MAGLSMSSLDQGFLNVVYSDPLKNTLPTLRTTRLKALRKLASASNINPAREGLAVIALPATVLSTTRFPEAVGSGAPNAARPEFHLRSKTLPNSSPN